MKLPLHKELAKIPIEVRMLAQYGIDMKECPACKNRALQLIKSFIPGNRQMMDNIRPDQFFKCVYEATLGDVTGKLWAASKNILKKLL